MKSNERIGASKKNTFLILEYGVLYVTIEKMYEKIQSEEDKMNKIAELFQIEGKILETVPHGCGYINDTYAVSCELEDGSKKRYILQRINHDIFKNPEGLMDNFVLVCDYLKNIVKILAIFV